MSARTLLHQADITRALTRIAHEVLESNRGSAGLVLLGIPTRGVLLASRLGRILADIDPDFDPASVGSIDVTMYRDDLSRKPTRAPAPTSVPAGGIDGTTVVLVDDVLYSGRTIRAALDAISDLGRPRAVRLAVLVDRGHRELPIRADFVGKNLPSAQHERIFVHLAELDGDDSVSIDSLSADPASAGTASTDPASADRASTDPGSADPASADPARTDPASTAQSSAATSGTSTQGRARS